VQFLPCYVRVPKVPVIVASIRSQNSTNNPVWYVSMVFNDAMKYLDYKVLIQEGVYGYKVILSFGYFVCKPRFLCGQRLGFGFVCEKKA
jgi:hypothetical protein